MLKTTKPAAVSEAFSEHYRQVLHWTVTEKPLRNISLQILSILLFAISAFVLFTIAIFWGWIPQTSSFSISIGEIGAILVGTLLTFVIHEVIHGAAMRAFGATPHYGVLWKSLMFYATAPGHAFRRNHYIAILLAPLVLISVGVVLGMALLSGTSWVLLLVLCGAINTGGAIGDIWMVGIAFRYAPTAYFVDQRDGMRVYSRINDPEITSALKTRPT